MDSTDTGYGPVVDSCQHPNALWSYANGGEVLGQLTHHQLLRKTLATQ